MHSEKDLLEKLHQEYQKSIPNKILYLEELLNVWSKERDHVVFERLKTAVHHLAGSAGTYGYAGISKVCQLFEHALIHEAHQESSLVYLRYIERIKDEIADGD